jgi:hypothetical protein
VRGVAGSNPAGREACDFRPKNTATCDFDGPVGAFPGLKKFAVFWPDFMNF